MLADQSLYFILSVQKKERFVRYVILIVLYLDLWAGILTR